MSDTIDMIIVETRYIIHAQSLTITPRQIVQHLDYIKRVENKGLYIEFVTTDETVTPQRFIEDVDNLTLTLE